MSSNIVPITLRETPWQGMADEIVIGKDILELLSSSMYVDPMTIYREYVQNAADSVDEARSSGILTEPGKVSITLDVPGRNLKIIDNGTGIGHSEFASRLTAFGASKKRGGRARGFRGVGDSPESDTVRNWCSVHVFRTTAKSARSAGTAGNSRTSSGRARTIMTSARLLNRLWSYAECLPLTFRSAFSKWNCVA